MFESILTGVFLRIFHPKLLFVDTNTFFLIVIGNNTLQFYSSIYSRALYASSVVGLFFKGAFFLCANVGEITAQVIEH